MGLETAFQRSQRWGCIVLFDEADIILQRRDRSDFFRNAIVPSKNASPFLPASASYLTT